MIDRVGCRAWATRCKRRQQGSERPQSDMDRLLRCVITPTGRVPVSQHTQGPPDAEAVWRRMGQFHSLMGGTRALHPYRPAAGAPPRGRSYRAPAGAQSHRVACARPPGLTSCHPGKHAPLAWRTAPVRPPCPTSPFDDTPDSGPEHTVQPVTGLATRERRCTAAVTTPLFPPSDPVL
jgi:hypothetical protein